MSLHYVLDGYNVIKQDPVLAELPLEAGRDGLLRLIETQQPQGSANNAVTVVFDGRPGWEGFGGHPYIQVRFSSEDTADDVIKRLVDQDPRRKSIVVVTDDREIIYYVRSLGARVLAVADFLKRIRGDRRGETRGAAPAKAPVPPARVEDINAELRKVWLRRDKS